jgi:hypothetical protein
MIEQRSDEWHRQRYGKITASEVHKLMCKDEKWSQTALSYIYKLAAERMLKHGCMMPGFSSAACDWGVEQEDKARKAYEEITGYCVDLVGFKTLKDNKFIGASADGLVKKTMFDDEYICGLEIKCPFNPENHIRFLAEKEICKEHYAQIQLNILVHDIEIWDYVSYCPLLEKSICFTKVKRDNAFIEKILVQCDKALKEIELICSK